MACIGLALLFSAASSQSDGRDYAAETRAIINRRGESASIVDCVLRTDEYDLSAGPMTDVAIDQLLESCRTQEAPTAASPDSADALAFTRPSASTPERDRTETLQAGLSEAGSKELDRLRDLCAAGSGVDCDRLFHLSRPDSDEEMFGLTCGDRPEVLDCADLVLEVSPEANE